MLILFQCMSVDRLKKEDVKRLITRTEVLFLRRRTGLRRSTERESSALRYLLCVRARKTANQSFVRAQERGETLQPCMREDKKEGRQTMGILRVMSRRGDDRVMWNQPAAEAGDREAAAAVREAERIFHAERARGATAYRVESGKPVERIEQFDHTAEQIVLVPRVVGG